MNTTNTPPSRKKPESGDGSNWLLSYADMMTLVCCFFILMMALANYDPVGFSQKAREIAKHFNKDKYKTSETQLTTLREEVSSHPNLKRVTKISVHDNYLAITFSGTALFKENQSQLTPEMTRTLDALIDLIKTKDSHYKILVEGHSSNLPVSPRSKFKSKWALSSARAASVVERFEYFGFNLDNLVAIGYGSSRPSLPNQDKFGDDIKENILLNNRVIIKVLENLDKSKSVKLGLGVYFKGATE